MKTIEQWLNELPEPYRSQALENVDEQQKKMMCVNILSAIDIFIWSKTKQGHKYWEKIYDSYE